MTKMAEGVNSKGDAGQAALGNFLLAAGPDKRRIALDMAVRLAIVAFAVALQIRNGTSYKWEWAGAILVLLYVIFVAWPLRHLRDHMEFYRNGILYRGKTYPVQEKTKVTWEGWNNSILTTTYLRLGGCRPINVTFIKDAKKLFNRAYGQVMY